MKKSALSLLLSLLAFVWFPVITGAQSFPYQDSDLSVGERVDDLVSRMTLEEKISQMQNGAAAIERLGIPEYDWWNECLHGVARAGEATVFPQAIGMAATWDPNLIFQEADIISTEARAKYNEAVRQNDRRRYRGLTMWSPNINIFRDPRWGRGQETYGEDPYLTSRIGVAFVKGLQGNDPRYFKVISTPKHFAVHSGPEPLRHSFDVDVSERDLHETYLSAFKACITEGKAYSIMGAYNRFRGESCSASELLLTKILREDWGFEGYVVSDCGAIRDIFNGHQIVGTAAEASALAVKSGCDLTCGQEYRALTEAIEKGLITEDEIDVSVRRLMTARFMLGMFDPLEKVPYAQIPISENNTEEHNQFALKVARESMVLLRNKDLTLPLGRELKSIAVIGPYADNLEVLQGNYNGTPSDPVTILQGIRNRAGEGTEVRYLPGIKAPEANLRPEPIDIKLLSPAGDRSGNGLWGAYFDNPDLEGTPVMEKLNTTFPIFWGDESPGEGIPSDSFSVRFTGNLLPDRDGEFEIGLWTDERGRLFVNDELLIDHWEEGARNFRGNAMVRLEKGKSYEIRIEYADLSFFAGLGVSLRKIVGPEEMEAMLDEAVELAAQSDVTVVVAGISPRLEGEEMRVELDGFEGGDRTSLDLPASVQHMIRRIHTTGKPVVLVLTSGSALAVNWENENIPAILQSWYPGQQGGNAVADVLFGNYNPAGRVPVTFYKSVDDLPGFQDYDMEGRTYRYFRGEPLYPFGYGLSFSDFTYDGLKLSREKVSAGDEVTISVMVTNTGERDGDEVVQLYVKDLESSLPQPLKSLRGFKRVRIEAGKSKLVEMPLVIADLGYYNADLKDFVVEPGTFEIQVGASSSDIRLTTQLKVK